MTTSGQKTGNLRSSVRLLGLTAFVVAALSVAGTVILGLWLQSANAGDPTHRPDWTLMARFSAAQFLVGFLINVFTSCVIFLVLRFTVLSEVDTKLIGEQRELLAASVAERLASIDVEEYQYLDDVPWARYIRDAHKIDIVVQGLWDWAKKPGPWLQFFENGGILNLILPQPQNDAIVRPMADRLNKDIQDQRREIQGTSDVLNGFRDGTNGKLNVCYVDKVLWYCAVRFDDRLLFLSFYEHFRYDKRIESPTYRVALVRQEHEHTRKWINKELMGFLEPNSGSHDA